MSGVAAPSTENHRSFVGGGVRAGPKRTKGVHTFIGPVSRSRAHRVVRVEHPSPILEGERDNSAWERGSNDLGSHELGKTVLIQYPALACA